MTRPLSRPWHSTAAYLYALHLDAAALAWEYLRRNPAYRLDWQRHGNRATCAQAVNWGLRALEDPARDGRDAAPDWLCEQTSVALLLPDPAPPADAYGFHFWALPGRKELLHEGSRLTLAVHSTGHPLRLSIGPTLEDGMACLCALRVGERHASKCQTLGHVLGLMAPTNAAAIANSFARPGSGALLAMRDLQVLDGHLAGASLREIAEVIFGGTTVAADWHADSHLRAKIRRAVRRGLSLMCGGYRRLLDPGSSP